MGGHLRWGYEAEVVNLRRGIRVGHGDIDRDLPFTWLGLILRPHQVDTNLTIIRL